MLQRNIGAGWGGGLMIDQYSSWTGGVFRDNSSVAGGAISVLNANEVDIIDVLIEGNTAENGGGIWVNTNGGANLVVRVTGATISGNNATVTGGGIDWSVSERTLIVTDSTITGNTSVTGAGLRVGSGTVTLTNTTVAENAAVDGGGGAILEGSAVLTATNCDFGAPPIDNTPDDVYISGVASWSDYGAGSSFTCDAAAGTCL